LLVVILQKTDVSGFSDSFLLFRSQIAGMMNISYRWW